MTVEEISFLTDCSSKMSFACYIGNWTSLKGPKPLQINATFSKITRSKSNISFVLSLISQSKKAGILHPFVLFDNLLFVIPVVAVWTQKSPLHTNGVVTPLRELAIP
jgi:hypothetical protein